MFVSHQIQVELTTAFNDFTEFLSTHYKVNSFHNLNNIFYIHTINQSIEEYLAFVEGVREIYGITITKETKLCSSKCRDGTSCLNSANGQGLCSKHSILSKPH